MPTHALQDAPRPDRPPRRIVSLVPSQTELLAALGLDAEVVGVTRFCVHPADWKARKTIVGGTKNVNPARVAALKPDLILANKEENERETAEALAALAPVIVTDVSTVEDALAMIRGVGRIVHREGPADALAASIAEAFGGVPSGPPIPVAYLIWRDPWMSVGGDTFISDVLARGGLTNVFGDRPRYPTVSLKEIEDSGAEAVLLSSEPYPFGAAHAAEVEAATGLPAVLVDGEPFSWYGPRMAEAPAHLKRLRARLG